MTTAATHHRQLSLFSDREEAEDSICQSFAKLVRVCHLEGSGRCGSMASPWLMRMVPAALSPESDKHVGREMAQPSELGAHTAEFAISEDGVDDGIRF